MKEKPNKMKTFALYVFLGVLLLSVINSLGVNQRYERKDYSWFIQLLNNADNPDASAKLISITINDREISGKYQESVSLEKGKNRMPQAFHTVIPDDPGLMNLIRKAAAEKINSKSRTSGSNVLVVKSPYKLVPFHNIDWCLALYPEQNARRRS